MRATNSGQECVRQEETKEKQENEANESEEFSADACYR
jgi:hypothetical protein